MKSEKGITLIALIITIIILLILAVVSINIVMNEGLIIKSKNATEESRGAAVQEQKDLWEHEKEMAKYDGTTARTLDELLDDMESDKIITTEEKNIIKETGEITIGSRTIVFEKAAAVEDYLYTENEDGTLTITGVTGNATILNIPSEIDGKTVTQIGEYAFMYIDPTSPKEDYKEETLDISEPFFFSDDLTADKKVEYYDKYEYPRLRLGMTNYINSYNLKENTNSAFIKVVFPNTIKQVGNSAFYGCYNLKEVILNENLNNIGECAFVLTGITSIEFPNNEELYIGDAAFSNCEKLKNIAFKGNVNTIGGRTFEYCINIEKIDNIKANKIDDEAFSGCIRLKNVIIDNAVTVKNRIFDDCYSLETIKCMQTSKPDTWVSNWNHICYDNTIEPEWGYIKQ